MALNITSSITYVPAEAVVASSMAAAARSGTATLVNGTVTVSDALVTSASKIVSTVQVPSGTLGAQYKIVPGTGSFIITAISLSNVTQVLDASTLQFYIIY